MTYPFHVVLSEIVKPLVAIAAHDQRKEVCDCVVVVGIGENQLTLEDRVCEGRVGRRNGGGIDLGRIEDECAESI